MSGKVVLVDDDPLLIRSTSRFLAGSFDVEAFSSGKEALAWLESGNESDVILSDLNMPEMNGIVFLRKAHDINSDASFYMLSGNQDSKMCKQAETHLNGIVERLINKPCNPTELVKTLEDGIKKSRAKRSLSGKA